LVWTKDRTNARNHIWWDVIRTFAGNKGIASNTNAIEGDSASSTYGYVSAAAADGFTVTGGSDGSYPYRYVNQTSTNYASWNWKAGGTPTATNSATSGAMTANSVALDGSLQSSYTPSGTPSIYPTKMSINTTNGFSIVSYTSPNSSSDETIPHGLSQRPDMVIIKNLDSTYNWDVWTPALQSGYDLRLNTTDDETSGRWSTTIPTASLVTLLDTYEVAGTDDYIAYCFHSVEGYSKVGSYEGNGDADGAFVYTGFRPAFLLLKSIDDSAHWEMEDDKRDTYNLSHKSLQANLNYAEDTSTSRNGLDFVSNGFKFRSNSSNIMNGSETYIYLAFAESPFKYSNAR